MIEGIPQILAGRPLGAVGPEDADGLVPGDDALDTQIIKQSFYLAIREDDLGLLQQNPGVA